MFLHAGFYTSFLNVQISLTEIINNGDNGMALNLLDFCYNNIGAYHSKIFVLKSGL